MHFVDISKWLESIQSPDRHCLGILGSWAFVNDHPVRAEPVPEHAETQSKKGFLHLHEDLATFGEQRVNAFRFLRAADRKGEISAAHWLKTVRRNIASHEIGFSDAHT